MNLPINGVGPAFPQLTFEECRDGPVAVTDPAKPGMSLRDYFAAAALAGLPVPASDKIDPPKFARQAYALADAMIAARETKPAKPEYNPPSDSMTAAALALASLAERNTDDHDEWEAAIELVRTLAARERKGEA